MYFEAKALKTDCYSYQYEAYKIEEADELYLCSYEKLLDYNVFHLKLGNDRNSYVSTKFSLIDIANEHLLGQNPLHH